METENKNQLGLFKIVIRDLRQKDQFKIDDKYISGGYSRECGEYATLVYISLCRHAEFNTQKAFQSQKMIAWEHGIHVRSVRKGIKTLMEFRIIMVEQERVKGKFTRFIYTLLDKSGWKEPNHRPKSAYGSTIDPKTIGGKEPTKDYKEIKDNKDVILTGASSGEQNDIEKLVKHYFEIKKLIESKEKPKRHFRAAGKVLTLCNHSLKAAKDKVDATEQWASIKKINWNLDTIIKRFFEIANKKT
jgi:hypothetical protein